MRRLPYNRFVLLLIDEANSLIMMPRGDPPP